MKQSPMSMESVMTMNELLSPPLKVKEFAFSALSGNLDELEDMSPISTWVLTHSDYAVMLCSIINLTINQAKDKQTSSTSPRITPNCYEDDFLKLLENPVEFLEIEKDMLNKQVIHSELNYLKNKRFENLKCLQGVFLLLEYHGCFKKIDKRKSFKCRKITHRQALGAFNRRYHIKRMTNFSEEYKKECVRKALLRLPVLEKIYQGKFNYFN
ncbi:MAG: hypothetical protein ACM3PR_00300 [Bacteroidales bacterium]